MSTPMPDPKNHCSVCGKRLAKPGRVCKCPWHKPFEDWPQAMRNTLRAMTRNGRQEK
jgi:hypothetical protein